ncbi:hypothetical protein DRO19_05460 [Candidatus Bathyarchaeota archaeon]|nr:MAG: hypothetical protein DRO19_05460 [Candidatus Bathyarchaeota archaeon]
MSREVVLNKTKIGRYCRTTVPDEVRKLLEIGEGDMIEWIFNDGNSYLKKLPHRVKYRLKFDDVKLLDPFACFGGCWGINAYARLPR